MQAVRRSMLLLGLVSLGACTTPPPPQPPPQPPASLAGSSWTLVAYRPAGGAEIRPAQPDQYQLHFQPDGRLAAKIDCNRGGGSWQATPADAAQGSLRLGPLALTRMMCPPVPLSARLPADIDAIQSFQLSAGQLQLKLQPDASGNAGSYLWQPVQP